MTTRKKGGLSKRPAASKTISAIVPADAAMSLASVPDAGGVEVQREGGTTMITGIPYLAHGVLVPALDVFFDQDVRPRAAGSWLGEADKVSWRDPATGYECILLRAQPGGNLGGYVGVPVSHPLYGFDKDAVPVGLDIEVHGGLAYSAVCKVGPTPRGRLRYEARRICHVAVELPIVHATDRRVEDDNVWWFGFTCDHVADLVPDDVAHAKRGAAVGVAQVYRNDAYVVGEVTSLAAQLRAVADGLSVPARQGPPLPPASLDPKRAK